MGLCPLLGCFFGWESRVCDPSSLTHVYLGSPPVQVCLVLSLNGTFSRKWKRKAGSHNPELSSPLHLPPRAPGREGSWVQPLSPGPSIAHWARRSAAPFWALSPPCPCQLPCHVVSCGGSSRSDPGQDPCFPRPGLRSLIPPVKIQPPALCVALPLGSVFHILHSHSNFGFQK